MSTKKINLPIKVKIEIGGQEYIVVDSQVEVNPNHADGVLTGIVHGQIFSMMGQKRFWNPARIQEITSQMKKDS